MQQAPNQKNTPNRRRPVAGRSRSTPQKVYASENDLPTFKPDIKPDNAARPATPQKSASTNQKQRDKGNKSRNKNGAVSPGHNQRDRQSPPFLPQDASAPIFAGSTFHASPAPSSLPIPSFHGVEAEGSPAIRANRSPGQEPSPPTTDSDEASPSAEPVPRNVDSPLEFFFRAQRAEKAKLRRASSANAGAIAPAPFSPPHDLPEECNTLPKASVANPLRRPSYPQYLSSPGISTNELGGTPGQPVGPAFSTPYSERIRAARSNQSSAQATPSAPRELDANSEALKRYLFTGKLGSVGQPQPKPKQQAPVPQPQQHAQYPPAHQVAQQHRIPQQFHQYGARQQPAGQQMPQHHSSEPRLPRGMFPASVLTGHSPNVKPTAASQMNAGPDRSEQILAMEGDLRRMLKLDSSS
ncbi:Uu.00g001410.m01.CDS01 [Anthostomella pinea]|uniref:Uu.00g001410.m01.CDS01 n=1 Tax=Anthostomella pinea TaxID=933095 RepID=A0AAI8VK33_9PEZI|nr:Uu.00g001410.m01.CDS01 [Anthostomella pinea]